MARSETSDDHGSIDLVLARILAQTLPPTVKDSAMNATGLTKVSLRPKLHDEWIRACSRLDEADYQKLAEHGIDTDVLTMCGWLGCQRLAPTGRLWVPDPSGIPMVLQPVFAPAPPIIAESMGVDDVEIIDLIAWRFEDPARWWYRLGDRPLELNGLAAEMAILDGEALVLHTSPLAWLQAGGQGSCCLDLIEQMHERRRTAERCREVAARMHVEVVS